MQKRVLIIGAGPGGLGTAWRLHELGHDDWLLIDSDGKPGGLSQSTVDDKGFVWDMGGHVVFSHYGYFDRLLDDLLKDAWVRHVREAWIWMQQRFIPYPLQNNIWRLPKTCLISCLEGLVDVQNMPPTRYDDFERWIIQTFGQGLADVFLLPYNFKVWAYVSIQPRETGA